MNYNIDINGLGVALRRYEDAARGVPNGVNVVEQSVQLLAAYAELIRLVAWLCAGGNAAQSGYRMRHVLSYLRAYAPAGVQVGVVEEDPGAIVRTALGYYQARNPKQEQTTLLEENQHRSAIVDCADHGDDRCYIRALEAALEQAQARGRFQTEGNREGAPV